MNNSDETYYVIHNSDRDRYLMMGPLGTFWPEWKNRLVNAVKYQTREEAEVALSGFNENYREYLTILKVKVIIDHDQDPVLV